MIVPLLGILDTLTAITIITMKFNIGLTLGFYLGIYLIIKGVLFFFSYVSMVDILIGIFVILAGLEIYYFPFNIFFSFWLIQKGFISFFH